VAQAITLAKNTHLPLHFLYVVNRDLMLPASNDCIHAVSEKMHQMGQAVLSAVENKTSALGIASETMVCQGNVGVEILSLCRDLDADYVILGCPKDPRANIFTGDSLKRLSQQIEMEVGAQVVLSSCR
jgi:nucleotide-binding universal stress UspA family protein